MFKLQEIFKTVVVVSAVILILIIAFFITVISTLFLGGWKILRLMSPLPFTATRIEYKQG
jgi:hypothetical protein